MAGDYLDRYEKGGIGVFIFNFDEERIDEDREITAHYLKKQKKGFAPAEIKISEGKLKIICVVLDKYAETLSNGAYEKTDDSPIAHEVMSEELKRISDDIARQIGYNKEAARRKCEKLINKSVGQSDIGEDALTHAIRGRFVQERKKEAKNSNKEKEEN